MMDETFKGMLRDDYALLMDRYTMLSEGMSYSDDLPECDRGLYEDVLSAATDLTDAMENLADALGVKL